MNKLTVKQRIYITCGGFLAALVLFIVFFTLPLIGKIHQESQKLIQQKQAIDAFYRDWKSFHDAQKNYGDFQEALSGFDIFLAPARAIKFISATESAARQTQQNAELDVLEKTAGEKEVVGADPVLNFKVSLQGSFSNLIKFLIHLESGAYYSDVWSLQISRVSSAAAGSQEIPGPNAGDIKSVINLSVYQP